MPPIIFNEFSKKNYNISVNPYKFESFSLGMVALELVYGHEQILKIYN